MPALVTSAALGFVLNWRFIATQGTYAAVVSDPSPVQHYWSLAIEEQFYLLFPLLVTVCLRRARSLLTGVLVALAGASLVVQLLVHDDRLRVYYGTDTARSNCSWALVGHLVRPHVGPRPR